MFQSPDSDVIPLCCCKLSGPLFNKASSATTYCQALDTVQGKVRNVFLCLSLSLYLSVCFCLSLSVSLSLSLSLTLSGPLFNKASSATTFCQALDTVQGKVHNVFLCLSLCLFLWLSLSLSLSVCLSLSVSLSLFLYFSSLWFVYFWYCTGKSKKCLSVPLSLSLSVSVCLFLYLSVLSLLLICILAKRPPHKRAFV